MCSPSSEPDLDVVRLVVNTIRDYPNLKAPSIMARIKHRDPSLSEEEIKAAARYIHDHMSDD